MSVASEKVYQGQIHLYVSRKIILGAIYTCVLMSVLWGLTHIFIGTEAYTISSILLGTAVSLLVMIGTDRLHFSRTIKELILLAYILRLTLAVFVAYGSSPLAGFLGPWDDFYTTSIKYFSGEFESYWTNYPYVLNAIYQFTGPLKIAPELINIFLWFLGYYIIQALINDCTSKRYTYFLLMYTFLPIQLLMTINIMRESIICFSLMLSFFFLLKWMKLGRFRYVLISVIAALPAIYMHRGNVSMWCAVGLVYIFWSPVRQKWKTLSRKTWLLPLGLFAAYIVVGKFVLGYLPSIDALLKQITTQWFDPNGRSNYVPPWSMTYRNPLQFIGNTLYLMFHFWISPMPYFWNSPMDLLEFTGDAVLWLVFYYQYFKQMKRKGSDRRAYAGVIIVFVFTLIYGWGTINAGTAMRHRDQLVGVLTIAAMVAARKPKEQFEFEPKMVYTVNII